jgi:hypothetical protein
MSRRVNRSGVGTHGTATHVKDRWRDFRSDMKSHTAKTWISIKLLRESKVVKEE